MSPSAPTQTWARLRQLGARREQLVTEATACVQRLRDLLDCAWPGVLRRGWRPVRSANWCAALAVVLDRWTASETLARWRLGRFEAAWCVSCPAGERHVGIAPSSRRCSWRWSTRPGCGLSGAGCWNAAGGCWPIWRTATTPVSPRSRPGWSRSSTNLHLTELVTSHPRTLGGGGGGDPGRDR